MWGWYGPDQHNYAVKVIKEDRRMGSSVKGELNGLKLNNRNIARTHAVICQVGEEFKILTEDNTDKIKSLEKKPGIAAVISELVPGVELQNVDFDEDSYCEKVIEVMLQLCEALNYMHVEHRMMHRDVKSENIIYDEGAGRAKLIDLNLIIGIENGLPTKCVGTRTVMAPEVIQASDSRSREPYDLRVDTWGAGAVLLDMLTGWVPGNYSRSNNQFDEKFGSSRRESKTIASRVKAFADLAPWHKKELAKSAVVDEKRATQRAFEPLVELMTEMLSPCPESRPDLGLVIERLKSMNLPPALEQGSVAKKQLPTIQEESEPGIQTFTEESVSDLDSIPPIPTAGSEEVLRDPKAKLEVSPTMRRGWLGKPV